MRNTLLATLLITTSLASMPGLAQTKNSQPDGGQTLGEVHFPISCGPAAQSEFNRAVAILHSFWYEEAARTFTSVVETDPDCAMGYWGLAMSNWYQLWYPPGPAALKVGSEAVTKARSIGGRNERERAYIEAIGAFYDHGDTVDHRTRSLAYMNAMQELYRRYPEDREAAVFYALALDATASPTDKSFAAQKAAAHILQKVFAEQPNHPGAAHYLIHSYDSPPLAALGIPAAICYSQIAPSVPHALHMPSHIFTRLGKWQESVDSNSAAAKVGQDYALRQYGKGVAWDQSLHAMDYLAYARLQLAEDHSVKLLVDQIAAFRKATPESMAAAYALAAIPARYAVERREWKEAATLSLPSLPFTWDQYPWTAALVVYARALGSARTGDIVGAQAEIDQLRAAHEAALPLSKYWSDQIEVQRLAAMAMVARAQGRDSEAIAGLQAAADMDVSMDKNNVTPSGIVPTRELLGDLLLELDKPRNALGAYEGSLTADPNRFRSLYGAAKAADHVGDPTKAKTYYLQLVALGSHADTERPELVEARAYLGY